MQFPFLSRSSHDAIIAPLEARIEELKAERDFYRDHFLKKVGAIFPVAPIIPTKATGEEVTINQVVERKGYRLDKSDWTTEDHDWFKSEWLEPQVAKGMPADEADYWYFERYRDQKPLEAFCNG